MATYDPRDHGIVDASLLFSEGLALPNSTDGSSSNIVDLNAAKNLNLPAKVLVHFPKGCALTSAQTLDLFVTSCASSDGTYLRNAGHRRWTNEAISSEASYSIAIADMLQHLKLLISLSASTNLTGYTYTAYVEPSNL